MILITCLEKNKGVMFNKRRLSKDSAVRQDIGRETKGKTLWMNSYSAEQFSENPEISIKADENFWNKAGKGEFCFLEGDVPSEDNIEKVIIYNWNRMYPSDVKFTMSLDNWKLAETTEFAGSSHEKITKEVYIK